jgi:hypothetical protein
MSHRTPNRLLQLEKDRTPPRRTCLLWVDARDTPAKRSRLIAAGRASPSNEFVHVRWKRRDET